MALVLDTGPILALLDRDDKAHRACAALIETASEPLVVVEPTLVEIDYWIRKRLQPDVWQTFVEDIAAGAYHLESLTATDLVRAAAIEQQYAEHDLGIVDAAVMAVCERLGEKKLATLDHRHFAMVRPRHCSHFSLLPTL